MKDRVISLTEFHKVLEEVEKYHKLKADIRNQAKAKVNQANRSQKNSEKKYLSKE